MGIDRRIRRNNNIAGLRAQLEDKEKEIYMLSQQHDMQRAYFDEVAKISTALKDILMRELNLSEDNLIKMLEDELEVKEATEIDESIKAEPSIEIVDDSNGNKPDVLDPEDVIEHTVTKDDVDANPGEDLVEGEVIGIPKEAVVEKKTTKKKGTKKSSKK
jgi:hypothetical protein